MITGTKTQEAAAQIIPYRQREGLNFSSIKLFEEKGPMVFYKEFIAGDRKELETGPILIGSMVDDIILTHGGSINEFHQHFDQTYCKFEGVKSSAQAFLLADYLFESLTQTIGSDGRVTGDFEICFREAFDRAQAEGKYKGKTWDKGLEDFEKTARGYFDNKINNIGKKVVDLNMITTAENVAAQLMTDEFTKGLLNQEKNLLLTKVMIDFSYLDMKAKAELDAIEIDHENECINGIDLKCTYDNEAFDYMYIKNKYYLQQAYYTEALKAWKAANGLERYSITPFKFVVGDTSVNKRRPLIYRLSSQDVICGYFGFKMRGYEYRGVNQIISDIKWHMENDIWNVSKEAFEKNGNLMLNINYDK